MSQCASPLGPAPAFERVCAVVVTFNRKELLRNCLRALQEQERPLDGIVVVDNASTDGTPELLSSEFPEVTLLRLSENLGGAGGFHEGFKHAYAQGFDWLWVMDDDGTANSDCLRLLMEQARPGTVVLPVQNAHYGRHGVLAWSGGRYLDLDVETQVPMGAPQGTPPVRAQSLLFTFVGPLIPRAVIQRVGLPRRDFFIWFDDFEYAMRIRRYTRARFIVVPNALMNHDPAISYRQARFLGVGEPKWRRTFVAWRGYYMARNSLTTLLHTRGRWPDTLLFLGIQLRLLVAVMLYDGDRWERAGAQLRGLRDGALGRMGKRH